MEGAWWAPAPETRLSQGDVIDARVFANLVYPLQAVLKSTLPGGRVAWTPHDDASSEYWLAKGHVTAVLVVSHSCEIDKAERKGRVLVAPIYSASRLPDEARATVFQQKRRSLLPLPETPTLGDSYCDLRLLQTVDRRVLEEGSKLATLSEAGVERLHLQLISFLTRKPE